MERQKNSRWARIPVVGPNFPSSVPPSFCPQFFCLPSSCLRSSSASALVLAGTGFHRFFPPMLSPSLISLTLPAWGPEHLAPEAEGSPWHPGPLLLPARTLLVDGALFQELIQHARTAARLAYAPFSNFRVGAALVMADDPDQSIITGANVENSSYSLTQCAERTALQTAAARGHRRLRYLAVSCAASTPDTPLQQRSPCGSCRQVLREFADQDTLVLIDRGTPDPSADVFDLARLLPHGFRFDH